MMNQSNTQRAEEGDEARRPPSPFLCGWKSVDTRYYPYPIPKTTKKRASQKTSSSCEENAGETDQTTEPNTKIQRTSKSVTSVDATQSQSLKIRPDPTVLTHPPNNPLAPPTNGTILVKKKSPNTQALFIRKPKKPTVRLSTQKSDLLIEKVNPTPTSINPDHQDDLNNYPLEWGSPPPKEKERRGRDQEEGGSEQGKTSNESTTTREKGVESELKELSKPLKLDRNLLEIIIRTVFAQIKLIDSRNNHNGIIEVLNDFKKNSLGLNKTHSTIREKKLTEAVNKRSLVEFEYKQVSRTIDQDLKTAIEDSVLKHKKILNAPSLDSNGLFGDDWAPKPVTYLDSTDISNVMHHTFEQTPTFDQPITTTLPCNRRQEPTKPSNNSVEPWSWGNDADNMATDPIPTNPSTSKADECPWGAEEPEEVTSKPKEPGSMTNGDNACGWGDGGGGNANGGDGGWGGKPINNNDLGGWSNGNIGNDLPVGGNWGGFDNNRPRDTGWAGRGRGGRGGGGGFSQDGPSGFRGRGRGFGGDGGGFRGRPRGFDGGGFGGGRGRGFGYRNGFGGGGNTNGFGDGGGWNNGGGFGDTGNGFGGGFNANQGGWRDDAGGDFKSGWGDGNGVQNGFGNGGKGTKGGFDSGFKSGWEDSGNDFNDGKTGGGWGDAKRFKTGGGGGFGAGGGGDGWQSPKVPTNRPMVQYDAIAPETSTNGGDPWGATNENSSATAQPPPQINPCEDNQAKDNPLNNDNGWGSPPPKEPVDIPSNNKPFSDYDEGPKVDSLPINLDYGGEMMLVDKTDTNVNLDKPQESAQKPWKNDSTITTDSSVQPVQGNEENECPW